MVVFLPAFIAVLVTDAVRVVVDGQGLAAHALGRAVLRVPLAEVTEADAVEVDAFWTSFGRGLRVDVASCFGLVTGKAWGVRSRRVDDAATAAGLLNTLVDRARPADDRPAG